MKATEYLFAVKAKLNITSDYALGKALKVSKQTAGKYARGEAIPGPVVAFRVAEILGDQPAAIIAEFEAERAGRDGKPDEADELTERATIARRLAALFAFAWVFGWSGGDGGHGALAAASKMLTPEIANSPFATSTYLFAAMLTILYIVSNRRKKKAGPFDGLALRVMAAARGLRDSLTLTMAPQLAPA